MKKKKRKQESDKLTRKQEIFCYEYCIDYNATRAAIKAGYSKGSARAIGCQNLTKVYISDRIKEMQNNLAQTAGISALRIIKEHSSIAFMDAGQLRDGWMTLKEFESLTPEQKACIQEVSTKQTKKLSLSTDGGEDSVIIDEFVKIKLYDKQKSLDSITKILGLDAPIKATLVDENGKDVISQIIKWGNNEVKV